MRVLKALMLLLAAGAVALGRPQDAAPPAESAPPPQAALAAMAQRVIVHLNRNDEVRGEVAEESPDLLVVRGADGSLHSIPKSRMIQLVRLVDPLPGQFGVVRLRRGDHQRGIIVEDVYDHVLIEIEGVRARLLREVVDHVALEPTFEERLRLFHESLASTYSPTIHYELCRWLFDERRYELAEEELAELTAKSKLPEAAELLRIVRAQLALKTPPATRPESRDAPADRERDQQPRSGSVHEADLLPDAIISAEDVNVMRVYEIDFADPPKVAVDADSIRALLEAYGTNALIPASSEERTALFRADPLQIARLMFELRARDFYSRIQVLSEPRSLNEFRRRVHNTWLINNCATSGCHGGVRAGRFFLHRRDHKDDRVRYTNLLILERLKINDQWPLINYDEPMMSLIIQYGLPRSQARLPHPPAKGWKPVFAGSNPRLLQGTVKWIESMFRPRPNYPVDYEPPVLGSPTGQHEPDPAAPAPAPGGLPADDPVHR